MSARYRYKFGTAVFDEAAFELRVEGEVVEIQRRPLQVLAILLANTGQSVAHEVFFRQVWQGRPTVANVLANAIVKIRSAIGPENSALILSVQRIGYRLNGPVERTVIADAALDVSHLSPGAAVPRRENFRLDQMLGSSSSHEVWLARHAKTSEARVFKFALHADRLSSLKREVTLARVLQGALGDRKEFVPLLDWSFSEAPYFIESEYGGVNLAEWALGDGRLPSTSMQERLGLFLQIARAVALAHGVAVLHKDIKPANVLLAQQDGACWVCRLVDFGSGRLLNPAHLDSLGITAMGLTVSDGVGTDAARATLRYAAPELLADEPASVFSDLYALGILLYQLAVGDMQRGLDVGWERDIGDVLLRADIARATDRDPARRFRSVEEFANAVGSLADRHAALAETARQAQQREAERAALEVLRRRRPWLHAVVALLGVGLLVTSGLFVRLRAAERLAADQLATAQALNRFLVDDFIAAANPAHTGRRDTTMAAAASQAAGRVDVTLASGLPEARAMVHAALQRAFDSQSDYRAALSEGDRAVAEWAKAANPDAAAMAQVHLISTYAHAVLGDLASAEAQLQLAWNRLNFLQPPPPELLARWHLQQGGLLGQRLQLQPALQTTAQAWAIASAPGFKDPDLAEKIELSLSDLHNMTGQAQKAEQLARDLLARQERTWGPRHVRGCYTTIALANALGYQGRADAGIQLITPAVGCLADALGEQSRQAISARKVLASLMFQVQRYEAAASAYAEVARLARLAQGPKSLDMLDAMDTHAVALHKLGKLQQAADKLTEALALAHGALAADHPMVLLIRFHSAGVRLDQGQTQGVAELLVGLDPAVLNQAEPEPDWEARLAFQRGRLAVLRGDRAQAGTLLGQARSLQAKRTGTEEELADIDRWLAKLQTPHAVAAR